MNRREAKLKKARNMKRKNDRQLSRRVNRIDQLLMAPDRFKKDDQDALTVAKYETQVLQAQGLQEKNI